MSANGTPSASASADETTGLLTSSRLLSYDESLRLLPWQTDNEYVLSGYRRQMGSIRACLWSAVSYLHNETVNIHTHSLGAIFYLILLPLHLLPTHFPSFSSRHTLGEALPTPPAWQDKLALTIYLLCAVGCLSLSSWFHTVQCHSKSVCDSAHRGDYIGIVILIVGSILPGLYYGFQHEQGLMIGYMVLITVAGLAAAYVVLSPRGRTHRWTRTLTFIALGLSSVIPVLHIIGLYGFDHARQKFSLDLLIAGGASYIFGAVLYAARFPESLSPGTFDYFGSSHQIFHVFVLVGAWSQYCALRGMVWTRHEAVGGLGAGNR